MSKTLVIAYSHTGTGLRLARLLCEQQGWVRGEVVESSKRAGATGTLRRVLDSWLRRKPAVRYTGPPTRDLGAAFLAREIDGAAAPRDCRRSATRFIPVAGPRRPRADRRSRRMRPDYATPCSSRACS